MQPMAKEPVQLVLDKRNLALAIIGALQMWSDEQYADFLQKSKPAKLTVDWFRWFVGEWKVARTIKDGKREEVRLYLDSDFRRAVIQGSGAKAIDEAALHIKESAWSAKLGKKKQAVLPISLVSKIGFFLRPSELVPLDRYSLIGLNILRRSNNRPKLNNPSYQQYLGAFDLEFSMMKSQLTTAMNEPWVASVAKKLNCPTKALGTTAMLRKVLDHYLMHTGGY
jgi:hypothetical protein